MKEIAVFGSSNIDMVLKVATMPKPGETIRSLEFDLIPGGKGANQACACGKLGGICHFFSSIGDDENGAKLINSLNNAAVDCSSVNKANGKPTGLAVIPVDEKGENSIIIVQGANEFCDGGYYKKIKPELNNCKIVLTQLETPLDTVFSLIVDTYKEGKITILNPAPAVKLIPDNVYSSLTFITPNETELEKLTGINTCENGEVVKAAEMLLAKGVENVIVTLGCKGAIWVHNQGFQLFPAFKTCSIDTTAAGDVFNAGLTIYLAEGHSIEESIVFANAAAAISVSRKGAQTSIPNRDEVINFLTENQK